MNVLYKTLSFTFRSLNSCAVHLIDGTDSCYIRKIILDPNRDKKNRQRIKTNIYVIVLYSGIDIDQ